MVCLERGLMRTSLILCVASVCLLSGFTFAPGQEATPASTPVSPYAGADIPVLELAALPRGIRGHGMASAAGRVYVIGGARGDGATPGTASASAEVWSFDLQLSGGVGPARVEKALPAALSGLTNACAAWGDGVIYVAGGSGAADGNSPTSDRVWIAKLGKNGVVESWSESAPWPGGALSRVGVTIWENALFVTGGLDTAGKGSAKVWRAAILNDGALGRWAEETPLPESRLGHAVVAVEGRMLVVGGRKAANAPPQSTAWGADLGSSPTLIAAWSPEPIPLPRPLADGAGLLTGRRFVWVGGDDGSESGFRHVTYAGIRDGHMRPWTVLSIGLTAPRSLAAAPANRGERIYVAGGAAPSAPEIGSNKLLVLGMFPDAFAPAKDSSVEVAAPIPAPTVGVDRASKDRPRLAAPAARFVPEQDAFEEARERKRPMLLVVHSSDNAESAKLWKDLLPSPRFQQLMAGVVLGEVDVAKDPAAKERYPTPVYPLYLVYDSNGVLKRKDSSARTLKDFAALTFDVQ